MKTLLKWLICTGSIYIVDAMLPNHVIIDGGVSTYFLAGAILWLVNIFIKPVAHLISIPFTILTLGLFSLIVNAAMVALADLMLPSVNFANFWICALVALFISAFNLILLPKT